MDGRSAGKEQGHKRPDARPKEVADQPAIAVSIPEYDRGRRRIGDNKIESKRRPRTRLFWEISLATWDLTQQAPARTLRKGTCHTMHIVHMIDCATRTLAQQDHTVIRKYRSRRCRDPTLMFIEALSWISRWAQRVGEECRPTDTTGSSSRRPSRRRPPRKRHCDRHTRTPGRW